MTEEDTLAGELFQTATSTLNARAAATMLAVLLGSLREALIKEGFTREEAMGLCHVWMGAWMQRTLGAIPQEKGGE